MKLLILLATLVPSLSFGGCIQFTKRKAKEIVRHLRKAKRENRPIIIYSFDEAARPYKKIDIKAVSRRKIGRGRSKRYEIYVNGQLLNFAKVYEERPETWVDEYDFYNVGAECSTSAPRKIDLRKIKQHYEAFSQIYSAPEVFQATKSCHKEVKQAVIEKIKRLAKQEGFQIKPKSISSKLVSTDAYESYSGNYIYNANFETKMIVLDGREEVKLRGDFKIVSTTEIKMLTIDGKEEVKAEYDRFGRLVKEGTPATPAREVKQAYIITSGPLTPGSISFPGMTVFNAQTEAEVLDLGLQTEQCRKTVHLEL